MLALWLCACRAAESPPPGKSTGGSNAQDAAPFNVLLVTLDTTRADHLGCYGYERALTPVLDALAARGTLFENAFTSCPLTLPAHATLMTGLQPPEHGLRVNGPHRLAEAIPTLAEVLRGGGYRTAAFVSAFVLNRKFGLDRGFDVYDDDLTRALEQEVPDPLSRSRPGAAAVDDALTWLAAAATAKAPFFLWVHLYDPHYPYYRHQELDGTALAGETSYDADVAYMDLQVGRLAASLQERGLAERTLVVAVGDHGEGLNDHGEAEHGYLLNHEALHVPLIVALPGRVREGQRVAAVVSLRDVFPSILAALGMSADGTRGGRSLEPALRGEPIESEPSYAETDFPFTDFGWHPLRSVTTAQWKYIRTARPELYERTADVAELYNLATARVAQSEELASMLRSLESHMGARTVAPKATLSAADKDRLAALGYGDVDQASARRPEAEAPSSGTDKELVPGLHDIKDMLAVKHLDIRLRRGMQFQALTPDEILEMSHELVERSPETAIFHARLGEALLGAGRVDDAAVQLREAVRLNAGLASAHLGLGRALARGNHREEAIAEYREALRLDAELSDAHFELANALTEAEQLDAALGHFLEAARLRPERADAQYNMANVLARRGKLTAAVSRYEEALHRAPDYAEAHFNLANVLRQLGRNSDAIAQYREAVRLRPSDVDARNNLGVTLAALGRIDEAREEYQAAIDTAPRFARARFNLANLFADSGDCNAAAAQYAEVLRLQPEWAEPVMREAVLLEDCQDVKVRNLAKAAALAQRAVELSKGTDPQMLASAARIEAGAGHRAEAARLAERAARLAHTVEQEELARRIEAELPAYRPTESAAGLVQKRDGDTRNAH